MLGSPRWGMEFRFAVMLECDQPARLVGRIWPERMCFGVVRGAATIRVTHAGNRTRATPCAPDILAAHPAAAAAGHAAAHCCSHLPAPAARWWPAALYASHCCDNILAGAKLMSCASRAPHAHMRTWLASIFFGCRRHQTVGARPLVYMRSGLSQAPQHACPVWHVKLSLLWSFWLR